MEIYKCPKCNATIEKDVTICGNCGSEIIWKNEKPELKILTTENLNGCADSMHSMGCLFTLIFTLPILLVLCSI